jgi:hypothetical protein
MPPFVFGPMSQTTLTCFMSNTNGMHQSMAMLRRNYRIKRPPPLGKQVILTHYVDANLYHNVLTGRSVTGVLHFLNGTPIDWYSKKQATVKSATYGSEFGAARTCVEQIINLCHTL